jgi:multidrug efflux pump subunit AcrB
MEKNGKAEPARLNIVRIAMRRPISVVVAVTAMVLAAALAVNQMPRDILPGLGVPTIYVAQPYAGMSPAQMESYFTYYYEYHFLYISGIEHVESKNIQSTALIKLQFHPGTNMDQALAETISYVNRAKAFMPEGVVPPFVMRFDAGSEPVGDLVFTTRNKNYSLAQIQNFALNFVRPLFATLPGVSAPPPFGASQRTVVITIDPKKLRERSLSPSDVALAISKANTIVPSGNIDVGDLYPIVSLNSVVKDIRSLEDVPLRTGTYPTVFLKDIGKVEDGSDIQTGYALVNGHRTVYIPVTKRANASTLSVVDLVRKNLPRFQAVLPNDVTVSYEFDQSRYVRRAISSLIMEGLLGAILSGLMVLLFLRSWRSSIVVVVNIPLALLSAVLALWISRQTVNIMTLGGLALSVGILVDEATVTIENIHTHLARSKKLARAALNGTNEILKPALLTMLCIFAVFIPSFFMTGVARALFVPLTLAVGFSVAGSFLLSRTLVPVLSTWLLAGHEEQAAKSQPRFEAFRNQYSQVLSWFFDHRLLISVLYLLITGLVIAFVGFSRGREIFPRVDIDQFQFRIRAPTGSKIEHTEKLALRALELIKQEAGSGNVANTVGFVGVQPSTYPVNTIYLWTSGPQEAVFQVGLKSGSGISIEKLKEQLRERFHKELPDVHVSFEASGLVDRSLSQGSPTPIEIAINGKDYDGVRQYAEKVIERVRTLSFLRDVQFGQVFDYPSVEVVADRRAAGLSGVTIADVGEALVPATSSSRYVLQNYWSDPKTGINYQVQVQVPEGQIRSTDDVKKIPVTVGAGAIPLERFSSVNTSTEVGEFDRYNMQRMVTITANLSGLDLGHAVSRIKNELKPLQAKKPQGVELAIRGQASALSEIFSGLLLGLSLAICTIFLLLAANFESTLLSLLVLSTIPSVLSGVALALLITGTSLNLESFMGTIMAIGVAVSNAILLVTFAERYRIESGDSMRAAIEGARTRLRPILMTTVAMVAGMIPMSLGLGEGGQQTAPLARAVIGGLIGSILATLLVLPMLFSVLLAKRSTRSVSLDPDDLDSSSEQHEQKVKP